ENLTALVFAAGYARPGQTVVVYHADHAIATIVGFQCRARFALLIDGDVATAFGLFDPELHGLLGVLAEQLHPRDVALHVEDDTSGLIGPVQLEVGAVLAH